jgi:hypothetical protein
MRSAYELAQACKILAKEKREIALEVLDREYSADELRAMLLGFSRDNPSHPFRASLMRAYGLKDLYFFASEILGYNHTRPSPDPANPSVDMEPGLHGEMAKIVVDSPKKKRLFLVPRGHMKSTVLTVADTIRRVCKNPNLRILLLSATGPTAESFLAEIKQHFDSNQLFRSLFPDRLPGKNDTWNQDAVQVGGRTIAAGVNTIEARGIDGNIVGRHYDYCKADDLVTKDNITTPEQRNKLIESFKALESVMEPYATWDVIGTRWHFYELYGWLIEQNDEADKVGVEPPYRVYIRKAIENGDPIFSAKYTKERLLQIKALQEDLYAKLYDNDPLPEEDREFKRQYFYLYKPEELYGKKAPDGSWEIEPLIHHLKHRGTTVDLAVSQKKTADYSVVCSGSFHPQGNLVVLDINRGRVTADKSAEWVIKHHDTWGTKVGYEAQGQQEMFETVMKLIGQIHRRYIPVQKLPGSTHSNEARIRGLLPLIQQMRRGGGFEIKPIWLPADNPHTQDIIDEFERFPAGRHDDMAVAIAYLPALLRLNRRNEGGRGREDYEPDNDLTGY